MNERAQKRIQENIKNKDKSLNLSHFELKEIPKELKKMVWLKSLDLSSNQISEIGGLDQLSSLQTLWLDSNQISEIGGLDQLSSLQSLYLSSNQISEIGGLDQLSSLQRLDLRSNQISEIGGLDQLSSLQRLYLMSNQISEIGGLDQLSSLQRLDLRSNQISEIGGLDQLSSLQSLDLMSNQISEIGGLDQLSLLQTLWLGSNQISEIGGLDQLSSLQTLWLGSNQISEIGGLDQLSSLQSLYLSSNQISEIGGLDQLNSLQGLWLDNNQISEIGGLDQLNSLQSLNLSSNQISRIEGLDQLSSLQTLNLANNQIQEIQSLQKLNLLEALDISNNKLSQVCGLDDLVSLRWLNLGGNEIAKIEGLTNLTNLYSLQLNQNQITRIEGIFHLNRLRIFLIMNNPVTTLPQEINNIDFSILDLSNTSIQDMGEVEKKLAQDHELLWESSIKRLRFLSFLIPDLNDVKEPILFYNGFFRKAKPGIYVKGCHNLKRPAPEWILLGPETVKNYFKALKSQGGEEMNEVKVLLVGDGGAGKTSLAYRLTRPKEDLPKQDDRTRGVDIYDWKYQKRKKKHLVHLWDFGGQVMYDMVHQYFYSQRSLYVLMDSSRSGTNENDSRLNQLLQSAELFGRNSQMVMIQNEHSGHEKKMDFATLNRNYPFLEEFQKTNLSTKEGFEAVKSLLKRLIDKIPGMGVVMPKLWMKVRREVAKIASKESTMPMSEFRKICKKNGIISTKAQELLSNYFHQLGVFLHFQNNPSSSLKNLIILNREWATKASYKVFDSISVIKASPKGTFGKEDLSEFWPEEEYCDFHPQLLDLMEEFEICFELKSTNRFLVPRMMDKMGNHDYCKSETKPLYFYYEYTFMPEGLLNRLSVRLHDMIGGEKGDLVWSDGVVFKEKGLIAELREIRQPDTNRISIKIIGEDAHWMSETLIREIDKINENFNLERLKVETLIPCNCSGCQKSETPYFLDLRKVKEDLQKADPKFHSFVCMETREKIDYHSLLKTISHKALKEIEEMQRKHKIGQYADEELIFKGVKSVEMAERMMTQDNSEITEGIKEIKAEVKKESVKTRAVVSEEADQTRIQLTKKLNEIPKILRKNIEESDEKLLGEMLQQLDKVDLEITKSKELIETVSEAINVAFANQPTQSDLLNALQQIAIVKAKDDSKITLNEKLKVSLWVIPTILKYEADISISLRDKIREFWKKNGLNKMIL